VCCLPNARNPDIHPSAAPTAAASGGALAAGKPTATYSRHSAGVGQAAAATTTGGKATAGGKLNAVLGPGVAGYTSVVTRSPISPSGYPVPAAPKPSGQHQLVGAGSHTYAQQQQQPVTSYTSLSDLMQRPGNLRSTSAEAQAAAAAAALAALNSHARSSSMLAEPAAVPAVNGSYAQQYTAKNYTPGPGPSSSSSRGSMLLWNIKQPPQTTEQITTPVAGRRAATAIAAGQQLTAAVPAGYIPSGPPGSIGGSSSCSSSRPSSQEAGSPGLLKLKQLSTARLARRLGTPPGGQPAQANSREGLFGQRPAEPAAAAAGPRSGQSSTGATPDMSQQSPGVQQPQQQLQQQHSPQPQSQRSAASIGRRADTSQYANVSSSSTAGPSAPLAASVQRGTAAGPARNRSNRQVSFAKGFDGATERGTLRQGMEPAEAEYVELARQPCSSCGRCFAPAALKQHMRICDKVFNQKRKVGCSLAAGAPCQWALQSMLHTATQPQHSIGLLTAQCVFDGTPP